MEFKALFPEKHASFLSKWEPYYVPKIIEIAKEEYPAIAAIIENFEGGDRKCC